MQNFLSDNHSTLLHNGISLAELIRRPELDYERIAPIDHDRPTVTRAEGEQISINIKYEGYIQRQKKQVEAFKKKEEKIIPENFDYEKVPSLRIEARQKLEKYRPANIGQASRISGVSPSDISVLLVYMAAH